MKCHRVALLLQIQYVSQCNDDSVPDLSEVSLILMFIAHNSMKCHQTMLESSFLLTLKTSKHTNLITSHQNRIINLTQITLKKI